MDVTHFVLKRGHHGRYKFCFFDGPASLKGVLTVDITGKSRPQQDAEALDRVGDLARNLAERASLTTGGTDDVPGMKKPAGADAAGGFGKEDVALSKGISR